MAMPKVSLAERIAFYTDRKVNRLIYIGHHPLTGVRLAAADAVARWSDGLGGLVASAVRPAGDDAAEFQAFGRTWTVRRRPDGHFDFAAVR